MFETSVIHVQARAPERRYGLFTVSVAAHAAVIVGLVTASLASVEMPNQAPNQMSIPVFRVAPALGNPDAKPAQPKPASPQPQPAAPRQPVPQVVTAPSTIPATVQPAATSGPATDAGTDTGSGESTGPVGVPWGSPDGVGVDGPPVASDSVVQTAPIPVGGDVKEPIVVRRVSPSYPPLALRAGIKGYVILECVIDRSGIVRDAKVLTSSSKMFESSALDAVQQWQFKPGTLHGQPVDVIFNLTVRFEINR